MLSDTVLGTGNHGNRIVPINECVTGRVHCDDSHDRVRQVSDIRLCVSEYITARRRGGVGKRAFPE